MRPKKQTRIVDATVYALTDLSGNPFYVGSTIQPLESRLSNHLSQSRRITNGINRKKALKIRELDFKIIIKPLETKTIKGTVGYKLNQKMHKLELYWMVLLHRKGFELTNGRELTRELAYRGINRYKAA